MTDYIIIALVGAVLVLCIVNLAALRKAHGEDEADDEREAEALRMFVGKIDESLNETRKLSAQVDVLASTQAAQYQGINNVLTNTLKVNREEQAASVGAFEKSQITSFNNFREEMGKASERQTKAIIDMHKATGDSLRIMQEQMSKSIRESVTSMTESNEKKLDEIRGVVNEKLDKTLNERLDSNFKLVGEQMANLYKSLGELQQLSSGVTNLNKTLSNVKTRGNWGEVQLGRILEQTLAREQYEENIATKSGSSDRVEYAIKLPNEDGTAYLPIDAKFPVDIYNRIAEAAENCDEAAVKAARNELTARIKQEASTISGKYLDPPNTSDYAIMYLPTEGLYAEVLRIDGLSDYCQSKRIMIAGPTTIMALLNTISIGFRHMALNRKSEEIRKILEATKGQIDKLEEAAITAEKRIDKASEAAKEIRHRTGIMRGKMRNISAIDSEESDRILGIESDIDDLFDED
ncbi:MAG: DNA recombination protein RmuC [Clostridiales bacterium]|nr:DNA recombination protein RmuC [Clostridiales bacterium]